MFKKKVATVLLGVMTLSVALTGCGGGNTQEPAKETAGNAAAKDVIKIGVFEPLTGNNAAGGQLEVEGVKLANKLYPEVLGKKVELVINDNKSDQGEAVTAVNNLIDQEQVNAIIGSWGSSYAMAAGEIIKEAGIPTVGASCTNPLVTAGNPYYFRATFIDSFQTYVLAQYAAEKGYNKVAIIKEVSNDYAIGQAKFFEDALKKFTKDENCIVANVDYQSGDQDFTAQLQNVAKANPDAIFAPGNFNEAALIAQQARQQGINTPLIGGDTWEVPEFLEIGGMAVEGVVITTMFAEEAANSEKATEFLTAFREEYKKEPSSVAVLGYDAYLLILDAIERAGSAEPQAIRDALEANEGFEGASGIIKFDENGDAIKGVVIKEVVKDEAKEGMCKFKYVTTVEPQLD